MIGGNGCVCKYDTALQQSIAKNSCKKMFRASMNYEKYRSIIINLQIYPGINNIDAITFIKIEHRKNEYTSNAPYHRLIIDPNILEDELVDSRRHIAHLQYTMTVARH